MNQYYLYTDQQFTSFRSPVLIYIHLATPSMALNRIFYLRGKLYIWSRNLSRAAPLGERFRHLHMRKVCKADVRISRAVPFPLPRKCTLIAALLLFTAIPEGSKRFSFSRCCSHLEITAIPAPGMKMTGLRYFRLRYSTFSAKGEVIDLFSGFNVGHI